MYFVVFFTNRTTGKISISHKLPMEMINYLLIHKKATNATRIEATDTATATAPLLVGATVDGLAVVVVTIPEPVVVDGAALVSSDASVVVGVAADTTIEPLIPSNACGSHM
jgi:hypothetical protein